MNKENENIEKEELMKIAPTLFGMKKVNNLKAPKGYFSNLADTVKVRIDNEVPDGYFENLADKVLAKIEEEETKVIPIQKRNIALYYLCCSFYCSNIYHWFSFKPK